MFMPIGMLSLTASLQFILMTALKASRTALNVLQNVQDTLMQVKTFQAFSTTMTKVVCAPTILLLRKSFLCAQVLLTSKSGIQKEIAILYMTIQLQLQLLKTKAINTPLSLTLTKSTLKLKPALKFLKLL
jgi:hypothetical protein